MSDDDRKPNIEELYAVAIRRVKAAERFLLAAAAMLLSAAILGALAACGGGDPDPEPGVEINPPNCKDRPEVCR